jgi:ankyrin repeat protein
MEKGATFDPESATKSLLAFVTKSIEKTENFVVDKRFRKIFNFLLRHGANIDGNSDGSALSIVCERGHCKHTDLIKYLVRKDVDLSICDDDGLSPLMSATLSGQIETVRFLLESGADVNQRLVEICADETEIPYHNALSHACYSEIKGPYSWSPNSNNPELIKLLLAYGAEPVLEDALEFSPLHMARNNGLTEIVKILEDQIANENSN